MTTVVVTGLGAISPLGNDAASTWEALLAGRSGIDFISRLNARDLPNAIGGEVRDWRPQDYLPAKRVRHMDRQSQLGAAAALAALHDAGLDGETSLGERAGVIFGTAFGGINVFEAQDALLQKYGPRKVSPFMLSGVLPDATSGHIAMLTGAQAPNMAVGTASASGATAIGEAAEIIRRGDADLMIAGAGEAPLTPTLYAGFVGIGSMAEVDGVPARACKPFDLGRTGFVPAEGAAAVVLESLEHARARHTRIYAQLAGYGSSNDAFHMVATEPTGRGMVLALEMALRKADIPLESIGYVNAHGTASQMNDRVETIALKRVFGEHAYKLAVSSTKSMTGHLMGAAGALEAVISLMALDNGVLPPTINYSRPDPECDLDCVPNQARLAPDLRAVMSCSVGLGGHNAVLLFQRV